MKIIEFIEQNGLLDKWKENQHIMAIDVIDPPYDVTVCPARGLVAGRLFLRKVDENWEFDSQNAPQIFMIRQTVWEKMCTKNALNPQSEE